jgi:teichuronic acid biosynthesis glycosyltransferase TuaG
MTENLVSIITPAYNCERYLPETIQSVLEQTWQNWEIIICDDGSTDSTGKIADDYAARDQRIIVIHQPNIGLPAVTRNRAARVARGVLIAFLDGDDRWKSDKLMAQVEYLNSHPEYEAIHTSYEIIGEPSVVEFYKKIWEWPHHDVATYEMLFLKPVIHISSLMVCRSAFQELGGFDEDPHFRGVEDYDFFLRLAARKPIPHIRRPLSCYRLVKGSVSHNAFYGRHDKSLLIVEKMERMGIVSDRRLIRRRKAEIFYNRAIESLYVEGGFFRGNFLAAFMGDPLDIKKLATFFSCWMPASLLRRWLRFLLAFKNRLIKRG